MSIAEQESKVLMSWEKFGMIDARKNSQIKRYRNQAKSVDTGDGYVSFEYETDSDIELADKPSASEVLIEQCYLGYVKEGRVHPVWGRCQNCASSKVARATHTVRKRMGRTVVQCDACGEVGTVRFLVIDILPLY